MAVLSWVRCSPTFRCIGGSWAKFLIMTRSPRSQERSGFTAGVGAYLLWGFLPLYFPLLEPATPLDISAHRVVWSWVVCLLLLMAVRGVRSYGSLLRNRHVMPRLALAAVLLSTNWLIFLFGVLTGRVVEASLGYFMNPIVTVVLAVVVLREKVSPKQVLGISIAAAGMLVLTVENGQIPWISLGLAFSFGLYGLMKKQVAQDVPALVGFAAETTALLPIAVVYLVVLTITGESTFGVAAGPVGGVGGHVGLVMFSGVATAVPLLLFAAATRRIPLVTIGMIQFMTPIMQFLTGVFIFNEQMSTGRWVGFTCVWLALVVLTVDGVQKARRNPRGV